MTRRVRKCCGVIALGLSGALGMVAPAHAVTTTYQFRPAQLDPLVWMGMKPGNSFPALTIPTPGLEDGQEWVLTTKGGGTFAPLYSMRPYTRPGTCLHPTNPAAGVTTVALHTSPSLCNYPAWQLRVPGSSQRRSAGLLAYGSRGSRVQIRFYDRDGDRCLGFYGVPIVDATVRHLPCSTGINQQWTLTRVVLP